jgi:hypothetical protein
MPKDLTKVINLAGFGDFPNKIVVPFAASLSKFLLLTFGVERYRKMYIALNETFSPEQNVKLVEITCRLSQKELLNLWLKSLGV